MSVSITKSVKGAYPMTGGGFVNPFYAANAASRVSTWQTFNYPSKDGHTLDQYSRRVQAQTYTNAAAGTNPCTIVANENLISRPTMVQTGVYPSYSGAQWLGQYSKVNLPRGYSGTPNNSNQKISSVSSIFGL